MDRLDRCHGLDVVGDDRVRILADVAYARRIFQNGGDPVRRLLSIAADVMIVLVFIRILFADLKDIFLRKVRKYRGME